MHGLPQYLSRELGPSHKARTLPLPMGLYNHHTRTTNWTSGTRLPGDWRLGRCFVCASRVYRFCYPLHSPQATVT